MQLRDKEASVSSKLFSNALQEREYDSHANQLRSTRLIDPSRFASLDRQNDSRPLSKKRKSQQKNAKQNRPLKKCCPSNNKCILCSLKSLFFSTHNEEQEEQNKLKNQRATILPTISISRREKQGNLIKSRFIGASQIKKVQPTPSQKGQLDLFDKQSESQTVRKNKYDVQSRMTESRNHVQGEEKTEVQKISKLTIKSNTSSLIKYRSSSVKEVLGQKLYHRKRCQEERFALMCRAKLQKTDQGTNPKKQISNRKKWYQVLEVKQILEMRKL